MVKYCMVARVWRYMMHVHLSVQRYLQYLGFHCFAYAALAGIMGM